MDFSSSTVILEKLIELGVDLNKQDEDGDTPLMLADMGDDIDIEYAHVLIRNGALTLLKNNKGETALDIFKSYHEGDEYSDEITDFFAFLESAMENEALQENIGIKHAAQDSICF